MPVELSRCESCRAPVRWLPTVHGRTMMVDPEPVGSSEGLTRSGYGNLAIIEGVVHPLKKTTEWTGPVYVAHYARCEYARRLAGDGLKKARERTLAKFKGDDDG